LGVGIGSGYWEWVLGVGIGSGYWEWVFQKAATGAPSRAIKDLFILFINASNFAFTSLSLSKTIGAQRF
jgi:hypothetical protein